MILRSKSIAFARNKNCKFALLKPKLQSMFNRIITIHNLDKNSCRHTQLER